jgi:DNA-binding winged helix-turn-helix (wHTH) protein
MSDWQNYIQVINDLQHRLVGNKRLLESILNQVQEALKETDVTRLILQKFASNTASETLRQEISYASAFAVADGKPLTKEQANELNIHNFDVVLDIPGQSLKVVNGKTHKFIEGNLNILGQKRFSLLEFLLENPRTIIGVHNIHLVNRYEEGILPNTLSRCIGVLRRFLQPAGSKGSYIINAKVVSRSTKSEQFTGHGYKINTNYRCLVILKKNSSSQDFP